eukprot:g2691.t1
MPPKAAPMNRMTDALQTAHLLRLEQVDFAIGTLQGHRDIIYANLQGYTHRSVVPDAALRREFTLYSDLDPGNTSVVVGSVAEIPTREIRAKVFNGAAVANFWAHLWDDDAKPLPLARGAPTLKACSEEIREAYSTDFIERFFRRFVNVPWVRQIRAPEFTAEQMNYIRAQMAATQGRVPGQLQLEAPAGRQGPPPPQPARVNAAPMVIPQPATPFVAEQETAFTPIERMEAQAKTIAYNELMRSCDEFNKNSNTASSSSNSTAVASSSLAPESQQQSTLTATSSSGPRGSLLVEEVQPAAVNAIDASSPEGIAELKAFFEEDVGGLEQSIAASQVANVHTAVASSSSASSSSAAVASAPVMETPKGKGKQGGDAAISNSVDNKRGTKGGVKDGDKKVKLEEDLAEL